AVRIERGDVRIFAGPSPGRRLLRHWIVDGDGMLLGGDQSSPVEYKLELRQVAGPAPADEAGGPVTAALSWRPGELRLRVGKLDFDTLTALAPADAAELAGKFGLSGQVWLNEFVQNAAGTQSADIGLSGVRVDLPLESDQAEAAHTAPAVRIEG